MGPGIHLETGGPGLLRLDSYAGAPLIRNPGCGTGVQCVAFGGQGFLETEPTGIAENWFLVAEFKYY